MARFHKGRDLNRWKTNRLEADRGKLRIVGGKFRGRQISCPGDPKTRPMKDNVREAVFNLVGGWIEGKAVFDLFAGTGAMGLEALSRGASQAFLIERHFSTAKLIEENVRRLDPQLNAIVAASDTFFWTRQFLKDPSQWPQEPWVVFCCPPYQLFIDDPGSLLTMIAKLVSAAPQGSLAVVESDKRFDPNDLPDAEEWTVRQYSPAMISVYKKQLMQPKGDQVPE